MAEARKRSDRLREKDAQHKPPACIREMGQAPTSAGRNQETPYASGGEGAGKPEARVELPEGSWQLHDPPGTPRCCCRGVLDTRDSHGAQTVTGSRNRRITKRGRPLRWGPHSSEEWRSCLRRTMRMVLVELRNHTTCTQEIPVIHQGEEMYVDPLSLVVRRSATLVKCRKKAPPRWKIGQEWFCGYPEIRPCNGPGPLPGHRRTNAQGRHDSADPDPGRRSGGPPARE